MLKLIGCILLLAGTTGLAYSGCMDLKKRLDCLRELKKMYEIFYSQVNYTMEALPEICHMTEERMKPPFSSMLRRIYDKAGENTGKPLPAIWKEESESLLGQIPFREEEAKIFVRFAENFGYADKELQKQAIMGQIVFLEEKIAEADRENKGKVKLYMSFGIMGGLLFAVILM